MFSLGADGVKMDSNSSHDLYCLQLYHTLTNDEYFSKIYHYTKFLDPVTSHAIVDPTKKNWDVCHVFLLISEN